MSKSAIVTLVLSILLILLGLGLVVYSVYIDMPHPQVYSYSGHGYSYTYSVRYMQSGSGYISRAYSSFGKLSFDAGLILMAIFVILMVTGDGKKAERKAHPVNKENLAKAAAKAEDATLKAELEKVAEKFRFSDPVSSEHTAVYDSKIDEAFQELERSVAGGDASAESQCKSLMDLIEERNTVCKAFKH